MPVATSVAAMRDEIERMATDPDASPAARVANLRRLRTDVVSLLGQIDTYTGGDELRRESGSLERVKSLAEARENADLREQLLARGLAAPEQLDAAGVLSHSELDALEAEGTLGERLSEAAIAPPVNEGESHG